jgi:phosphoribosylamine-glycine ligase
MRIWLIGADARGAAVVRQLQKNQNLEVFVSHPTERPKAVTDGLLAKVNLVETVTPVNINTLARRIRPDLILIDTGADAHSLGRVAGGSTFTDAINQEIVAASDYPCILL